MQLPDYIKKGSTIGIVAPAGKIDPAIITYSSHLLQEAGFKVKLGKHLTENYYQFSATDAHRAADLQSMLDDANIDAIFCARGGYGVIRIIEHIDFTLFKRHPKWIVGFSDITVLHGAINNHLNIATIHGPMPKSFVGKTLQSTDIKSLLNILQGKPEKSHSPFHNLNRIGNAKGEIVGGNLSLISSLRGSPYDFETNGKILFIEDLSEYLYHIDRMMFNMKLGGKLEKLAGIIIGQFTDLKDNSEPFGQSYEEIILNSVSEYNFPVCFNFPAGHIDTNMPIIFGREANLSVSQEQTTLSYI